MRKNILTCLLEEGRELFADFFTTFKSLIFIVIFKKPFQN